MTNARNPGMYVDNKIYQENLNRYTTKIINELRQQELCTIVSIDFDNVHSIADIVWDKVVANSHMFNSNREKHNIFSESMHKLIDTINFDDTINSENSGFVSVFSNYVSKSTTKNTQLVSSSESSAHDVDDLNMFLKKFVRGYVINKTHSDSNTNSKKYTDSKKNLFCDVLFGCCNARDGK